MHGQASRTSLNTRGENKVMKIKCISNYNHKGNIGILQVFYNKSLTAKYARHRLYKGVDSQTHKPIFEYTKVSVTNELQTLLESKVQIENKKAKIEQNNFGQVKAKVNIEQDSKIPSLNQKRIENQKNLNNNFDLNNFKQWLISKEYQTSTINTTMSYASRYGNILFSNSFTELDTLNPNVRNNVIKALILISKYLGKYTEFKATLSQHDIKFSRPDNLAAFLRILNSNNKNTLGWYNEALTKLRPNEQLFLKFLLHSGLRTSEGITSFNKIVELSNAGFLNEYYDSELGCLMHFKYPKQFIRKSKNAYVTFITAELLEQISHSQTVSYACIRKRLDRAKMTMRLNEFRKLYGTHLVSNGITETEQNLVCGRIATSIFVKHYWSPQLKLLGERINNALATIENSQ